MAVIVDAIRVALMPATALLDATKRKVDSGRLTVAFALDASMERITSEMPVYDSIGEVVRGVFEGDTGITEAGHFEIRGLWIVGDLGNVEKATIGI